MPPDRTPEAGDDQNFRGQILDRLSEIRPSVHDLGEKRETLRASITNVGQAEEVHTQSEEAATLHIEEAIRALENQVLADTPRRLGRMSALQIQDRGGFISSDATPRSSRVSGPSGQLSRENSPRKSGLRASFDLNLKGSIFIPTVRS